MSIELKVLIFLVGYVLSYIILRWSFKKDKLVWTVGDRYISLVLSLFSWVGVFAGLLTIAVTYCIEHKKEKASW